MKNGTTSFNLFKVVSYSLSSCTSFKYLHGIVAGLKEEVWLGWTQTTLLSSFTSLSSTFFFLSLISSLSFLPTFLSFLNALKGCGLIRQPPPPSVFGDERFV